MESLAKVLDFLGKYSWAVLVAVGFVLFIPADAASQIGLDALRTAYKGPLWILLVLSATVWLGAIFRYFDKKLFDNWLTHRTEEKRQEKNRAQFVQNLGLRLNSLDPRELMWIKYCLYYNVQSLAAELSNGTAQSLKNKGIVSQGSGSVLGLPFHIPDDVWRYLREHAREFLSDEERNDSGLPLQLESFRQSLVDEWFSERI
jgi:hypothetical protein